MKHLRSRWTVTAVALSSVALMLFALITRPSPIDGLAFADADEVKIKLNAEQLQIQDALFKEVTSPGQFYKMTADELRSYYHVANAVWYKDGKVLGYSFDRRGRKGYGTNEKSPVLLSAEGDTVKFAGCLGPQT